MPHHNSSQHRRLGRDVVQVTAHPDLHRKYLPFDRLNLAGVRRRDDADARPRSEPNASRCRRPTHNPLQVQTGGPRGGAAAAAAVSARNVKLEADRTVTLGRA